MSGKYLKARQLAKEMEEKAKKTAEKKKEANSKKEKAEDCLEIINSLNIDMGLDDLEQNLEEGKEKLENKNFEKSYNIFEETIEEINSKILAKHDEILDPIEELLQQADGIIEIETLKEKIKESKNLIQEGNFEEAFEKAFELENETYKSINKKLNKKLEKLNSILELISEEDEEKEKAQEFISKAEYSLEAEDYSRTFSLLRDAKETFGEGVKNGLIKKIKKLEGRKKRLKEKKIELKESEEWLEKARSKTNEEEYIEALKLIEKIKDKINPLYGDEILRDKFNKLAYELKEAKEIGANIDSVKRIQDEVKKHHEENNIEKAESRLKDAFEELEEAKFNKVLNTIAESREDFIKAKEMGADIEKPMELLKKARNSLKNDNYKEALDWAKKGRKEVKNLTKELEKAKEDIIEKKEKVNRLKEILGEDFSGLIELIDEAEKKIEEKRTDEAISLLKRVDDKINSEVHNRILNLIDDFETLNQASEKIGIDIEKFSKQKEKCKIKIDSSQYVEAAELAQEGMNLVKKEIEDKLSKKIKKIREGLNDCIVFNDKSREDLDKLIRKSREKINEGSHIKGVEKLEEAEDLFEETKEKGIKSLIEKSSKFLSEIKDLDKDSINFQSYRKKIEEAKNSLNEKMYSKSLNILEEYILEFSKEIHKKSEKEIQKAEEMGIGVEDLEDEFTWSSEKIEDEDYIESIQSSIDIIKEAQEKRRMRKEAYEKIYDGSSKISEFEEKNQLENVDSIKDTLKKAKRKFKQEEYSDAIDEAEKALDSLKNLEIKEKFYERKKELENKFLKVKNMEIADERTNNFDPELEKIDNMSEEIGIPSARDKLQSKHDELNNILEEILKEKIEEIEEFIENSKASGFDMENYKGEIKRIKSLKDEGKILDALIFLEEIENEFRNLSREIKIAREKIEEVRTLSKKAEVIGTSTSGAVKLLEEAQQMLDEDHYKECLKKTEEAENKIQMAQKNRVESILENFNQKIKKLKNRNVDTSLAEDKIQKARESKDKGDYIEAIKFSMQSEGELEKINNQKIITGNIISRTKRILEDAKKKGIFIDEATNIFKDGKQAYDNGFYPKAIQICLKSVEELSNVLHRHNNLNSFIENINSLIEDLDNNSMYFQEVIEEKKKMEENFKNGKYRQASEEMENIKEILNEEEEDLKKIISNIENEIKKDRTKNIKKSEEKLNKAKYLIEKNIPAKALKHIREVKKISGLQKKKRYEDLMQNVEESIKNAKKFGASVENIEKKIQEAKNQKSKREIDKAYDKIKQACNMVKEVLEDYSPKIKLEIPDTLVLYEWNSTTIYVINEGEALGKNLQIEVRGGELRNFDLGKKLKAGEEKEINVEVKPEKENAQMIVRVLRIFDDEIFEDKKDLDVSRGSKIKKIDEDETCDYCGNKITKGKKSILCSCGKTYDISCAEEIGKCPNCGTRLKTEKREKKKRVSLDI